MNTILTKLIAAFCRGCGLHREVMQAFGLLPADQPLNDARFSSR